MIPLSNSGDLVEELIFNVYKDKDVISAKYFKEIIKKDYGYNASSGLYRKIINYQVKKYGRTLQKIDEREYVKWFGSKTNKSRTSQKNSAYRRVKTEMFIERVENEKDKCKKSIKRKNTKTNIN